MSKVNPLSENFAGAFKAAYEDANIRPTTLTGRRLRYFKAASFVAKECGCQYCEAVVDALYDALADHGEIA